MRTDNIEAGSFGMTNELPVASKVSPVTWMGLFISLFAMLVIRQVFVFFVPDITFASAILKEALIWASAAALIVTFPAVNVCRCAPLALELSAGGFRFCGDL